MSYLLWLLPKKFLVLIFSSLIMMFLNMGFFEFFLFGVLWASWIRTFMYFTIFWKFSAIIALDVFEHWTLFFLWDSSYKSIRSFGILLQIFETLLLIFFLQFVFQLGKFLHIFKFTYSFLCYLQSDLSLYSSSLILVIGFCSSKISI